MENRIILAVTSKRVHWNDERSNNSLRVSDGFIWASRAQVPTGVFFTRFGFVRNQSFKGQHAWEIRLYRGAYERIDPVSIAFGATAEQMLRGAEIKSTALLMTSESFEAIKGACAAMDVRLFHHHCNGDLYES